MSKSKDLTGQKFGKLTAISRAESILGGDTVKRYWGTWNCLCECGNTKIVKTVDLNRGSTRSCGCIVSDGYTSLVPGQQFGRLTTISYKNGQWSCSCECGNNTKVTSSQLTSGNTKSCGCLNADELSKRAYKLINGRRQFDPKTASARRIWYAYGYRDSGLTVTFDEFFAISQHNCLYCGIAPSTEYNFFSTASSNSSEKAKNEGLFIYNGMDRIDSSKPHTPGNVVPCCIMCNRSKNDRSTDEFLQWVSRLKIIDSNDFVIQNIQLPGQPLAASIRSIFYGYKKDTDMSVEDFYSISQMNCFHCGNYPNNFFDRGKSDKKAKQETKETGCFYYNGLDRIDSSKTHTLDNVVPCCKYCNFAKSKLSLSEFQSWIRRIQQFQKEKGPNLSAEPLLHSTLI